MSNEESPTNTELAVLGLVAEKPKHGYEIEQHIQQRGMREWTEIGFSSIYYILNKLEEAGLLSSALDVQADRPARKVYQLTAAGWAAYSNAVRRRLAHPRPRSGDFDLALANLPALPAEEVRAALQAYGNTLRENQAHVRAKWISDRTAAGGHFAPNVDALFSHSLAMLAAELKWVESYLVEQNGGLHDQA
ncbi:MAG TPA: PadR family transcriptional regulator [Anaerolineaceae bacterium]|nr:PadR family transcriptional regulator [Anaerolineaceae bacterium]